MEPKFTNSARYKCLEYLKKHSVELYLSYCGMEECYPGHSYGPTKRTEYLLHYIIDGKGIFEADGKTFHLGKNYSFIIYPDEITYYKADQNNPWTYIWIGFGGIKAETCLNYASLTKENRVCQFDCGSRLVEYVKGMLKASQLTYANDLKREAYLFLFLSALIHEKHYKGNHDRIYYYPSQVYVEHALEFIDHNFDKKIKVNDIANYIGIDRSYLANIFKKSMGMSPQQYLVNYRLERACGLLKTTSLPISNIATRVGYNDPLSFSKVFKMFYNTSPKAYRMKHEELIHASKKE